MLESGRNIFLHHIDDIRDDFCDKTKKIEVRTNDIMPNRNFFGGIVCGTQPGNAPNSLPVSFQC